MSAYVLGAWLASNSEQSSTAHLALHRVLRGDRTGRVLSRYAVAACTGKQLGGVRGQHDVRDAAWYRECPRCLRKRDIVATQFALAMADRAQLELDVRGES